MSTTTAALARVLVVDDELGPRESLRMLLKPAYAIQTAENGRTALDLLRRFQPDVVIMDIKMPEMDGLELLRHVKRADPSIEVVMITAYASLETGKHALAPGAAVLIARGPAGGAGPPPTTNPPGPGPRPPGGAARPRECFPNPCPPPCKPPACMARSPIRSSDSSRPSPPPVRPSSRSRPR